MMPDMSFRQILLLSVLLSLAGGLAFGGSTPRDDGDTRSLLLALDRQEQYLQRLKVPTLKLGSRRITREEALATVRELRKLALTLHGRPEFGAELSRRFEIVTVSPNTFFTGYHSPVLQVSDRRTDRFRVPILGYPPDLTTQGGKVYRRTGGQLTAAPTRGQIMDGAYPAENLAVAWTDDPVSFYYTQIQGSAILMYPDGRRRTLLFAGTNGYPYQTIETRITNEVPAGERPGGYQGMRDWLRRNPAKADAYFRLNPRYIFFKVSDQPPMGMSGLPLTARRSIATDKHYYSAGLMALVEFTETAPQSAGSPAPITRQLIVADADTGAAIKGPDRVDLYFGEGSLTELFPHGLHNRGTLSYLLLKKAE